MLLPRLMHPGRGPLCYVFTRVCAKGEVLKIIQARFDLLAAFPLIPKITNISQMAAKNERKPTDVTD